MLHEYYAEAMDIILFVTIKNYIAIGEFASTVCVTV